MLCVVCMYYGDSLSNCCFTYITQTLSTIANSKEGSILNPVFTVSCFDGDFLFVFAAPGDREAVCNDNCQDNCDIWQEEEEYSQASSLDCKSSQILFLVEHPRSVTSPSVIGLSK